MKLLIVLVYFQAYVPYVPGPAVWLGPPGGVHAGHGLCSGGRQAVPIRLPHVKLGSGGEG